MHSLTGANETADMVEVRWVSGDADFALTDKSDDAELIGMQTCDDPPRYAPVSVSGRVLAGRWSEIGNEQIER